MGSFIRVNKYFVNEDRVKFVFRDVKQGTSGVSIEYVDGGESFIPCGDENLDLAISNVLGFREIKQLVPLKNARYAVWGNYCENGNPPIIDGVSEVDYLAVCADGFVREVDIQGLIVGYFLESESTCLGTFSFEGCCAFLEKNDPHMYQEFKQREDRL